MLRKLLLSLFFTITFFSVLALVSKKAEAANTWNCSVEVTDQSGSKAPTTQSRALKLVIHTSGQGKSGRFLVTMRNTGAFYNALVPISSQITTDQNGDIIVNYFDASGHLADPKNSNLPGFPEGNTELHVYDQSILNDPLAVVFNLGNLINQNLGQGHCGDLNFNVKKTNGQGSALCAIDFQDKTYGKSPQDQDFDPTQYLLPGASVAAKVDICPGGGDGPLCKIKSSYPDDLGFQILIKDGSGGIINELPKQSANTLKNSIDLGEFIGGDYLLDIKVPLSQLTGVNVDQQTQNQFECSKQFKIDANGGAAGCTTDNDCVDNAGGKYCLPDKTGSLSCQNSPNQLAINPCVTKGNDFVCQTAIGAIGTSAGGFAQGVLQLFLGLAGLILLFTIILNGYKFMTSQGDPEKVKEARESITAAIAGLLVIIFSIVILQLITVDILHLPGFN